MLGGDPVVVTLRSACMWKASAAFAFELEDDMDATELLKQQHDEVKDLFGELEQSGGKEREALFLEIADALEAHSRIEEQIFYPRAYTGDRDAALADHMEVRRMLADMLTSIGAAHFAEKAQLLQQTLEKHIAEEEREFTRVRNEIDAPELERLGTEMEQLYDQLMPQQPSQDIPSEIERPPAQH